MRTLLSLGLVLVVGSFGALGCGSSVSDGAGGGGEGGGGTNVCEAYEDSGDLAAQPVTLRFVNDTAADLFLGDPDESCDGYAPFSLGNAAGDPLVPETGICSFTCGVLMAGGCNCPAVCAQPTVVRIIPGGSYETAWGGVVFEEATLPEACIGEDGCSGSCLLPSLPSGALTFTGEAFPAPNCDDCTCTPDVTGACVMDSATSVTGAEVNATATFTHDGQAGNVIELVFE